MNRMKITLIDGSHSVVTSELVDLSAWFKNRQDIVKAEFLEIDDKVKEAYHLFFGCSNLEEFKNHVDLANVNLGGLFFGCNKLKLKSNTLDVVDNSFTVTEMSKPLDSQVGGSHYKDMTIQPIEYILGNNLGFCEGNIIKYISRYKNKNGIEDLKKVKHYVEILIKEEENKC